GMAERGMINIYGADHTQFNTVWKQHKEDGISFTELNCNALVKSPHIAAAYTGKTYSSESGTVDLADTAGLLAKEVQQDAGKAAITAWLKSTFTADEAAKKQYRDMALGKTNNSSLSEVITKSAFQGKRFYFINHFEDDNKTSDSADTWSDGNTRGTANYLPKLSWYEIN
ncbi:MAG: hypothetical protein GY765_31475, partial [bacterium]|nr:hypothetical protein [bacterium]